MKRVILCLLLGSTLWFSTLARAQPTTLGVSDMAAAEYDWAFEGSKGREFKELVKWAAAKVDLDPGLLGANLISETRRDDYLTTTKLSSFVIGVDDYLEKSKDISKRVPAASEVRWTPGGTNINEKGRKVNSIDFPDGKTAILASAVYLKHGEELLREEAKGLGGNFDRLPRETRFVMVRLAFNAGLSRAKENLAHVIKDNKEVLVREGPEKSPWGPQRAATVLTARAMRLSTQVFGR